MKLVAKNDSATLVVFLFLFLEYLLTFVNYSSVPFWRKITDVAGSILPVVSNLDFRELGGDNPANYVVATILIFPLKIVVMYFWMKKTFSIQDWELFYISPLNNKRSASAKSFFLFGMSLFVVGFVWFVFIKFGAKDTLGADSLPSVVKKHSMMFAGGFKLWMAWACAYLWPLSLVLAAYIHLLNDWKKYRSLNTKQD